MADDKDEALPEMFWSVAHQLRHQSELSDHLRIAPRSTTEVVDALEERGLVERTPDPHDRRATLVSMTDEGRRVGKAMWRARDAAAEQFFGQLSDTDRAHLTRILRKLRG